ncbi:flagellar filament capping protein FliD [uncultured Tolumonas sp.]|uniref:flagellar filament capping protein FliD n=1 Tax=uncultured Tolumonas sp. TaxID=263765 RepID=UPI002A0A5932|nr:flagellar filament capping protein FliD [uncultured Tolumonas sp.]
MTAVTSAGAGSGLDLESIISSSVAAKKAQLMQPLIKKQNQTQITLSGLGQLSSIISNFKSSLDALSASGAFNKRSVNITQTTTSPVLQVTANSDASNGQYNITVNKLATTSQWGGVFDKSTTALATQDGKLTFTAGSKSFTVDVKAGDTLQNIRKRINSDGDNFGLSANIINTSDGKAKLVIDSGISGDGKDLSISASTGELGIFATSKMSQTTAASSSSNNVFTGLFAANTPSITQAGKLTIQSGSGINSTFTVDVNAGDSLQAISDNINSESTSAGSKFTSKVVTNSDGTSTLIFDSGINGDSLSVSGDTNELSAFTTNSTSKMAQTQLASSALIDVDGNTLKSDTNTFNNTIQGLKVTALRTSDKDATSGSLTSNKVAITTDTSSITSLVQNFISAYNTMVSKTTSLSRRDSIVAGVNQNNGGALAGDSMVTSIKDLATNMLLKPSTQSSTFSTIFELGVKMDNDGVLSLDTDKFNTALSNNFDQVVALFGGKDGVAGTISSTLDKYTQTGGLISIRQDGLNTQLRSITTQENNATNKLTQYETNLRKQYGNLDTLLANMKSSASYLTALSSSTTSSSG